MPAAKHAKDAVTARLRPEVKFRVHAIMLDEVECLVADKFGPDFTGECAKVNIGFSIFAKKVFDLIKPGDLPSEP